MDIEHEHDYDNNHDDDVGGGLDGHADDLKAILDNPDRSRLDTFFSAVVPFSGLNVDAKLDTKIIRLARVLLEHGTCETMAHISQAYRSTRGSRSLFQTLSIILFKETGTKATQIVTWPPTFDDIKYSREVALILKAIADYLPADVERIYTRNIFVRQWMESLTVEHA